MDRPAVSPTALRLVDGPTVPIHQRPVPSPGGDRIAWVRDLDGRSQVWVAPLPASGPVREPSGPLLPDADVTALSWSPDGAVIACQIEPTDGGHTRIELVDPDTGRSRTVGAGAPVTLGPWSPSGHHLGVTVHPEGGPGSGGISQACLYDLRDETSTVLTAAPAAHVCAIDGDARHIVLRHGLPGALSLELLELRSGTRVAIVPGGAATVADARFGASGGRLYVHTDAGGDRPALLAVAVRGAVVSAVQAVAEHADDDLDLVVIDPAGTRAALVWDVGGLHEIELIDLRSGLVQPVTDAPGPVVTAVAFAAGGSSLLVGSEGSTITPRITRIALAGYAEHTAVLPAAPGAGRAHVEPTQHAFPAADGRRLSGWLLRPRGALGALPTLVWLYDGPARPRWEPLFQALTTVGVAVFAPTLRDVSDVRATAEFLTGTGLADPLRIGIAGRSLVPLALSAWPELFAAGVHVGAPADRPVDRRPSPPLLAVPGTAERAAFVHEVTSWVTAHLTRTGERTA